MKNMRWYLILFAVVIVVVIFGVGGWMMRHEAVVIAPDEAGSFTPESGGLRNMETKASFERDGVVYDFKQLRVEEAGIVVKGCVSMPDERFWMPILHLTNVTTGEEFLSGSFANEKDPSNNDRDYRCHEIEFFEASADAGDVLQVNVVRLEAYLDPMISDGQDLELLRERVAEELPGVRFELVVESGNGGGGGRFEIVENPNEVPEATFYEVLNEASVLVFPLGFEFSVEN